MTKEYRKKRFIFQGRNLITVNRMVDEGIIKNTGETVCKRRDVELKESFKRKKE